MAESSDYTPLDLALYMVSSARDCVEEPLLYGPIRLLIGVDRLATLCENNAELSDEFLSRMKEKINKTVLLVMSDRNAFVRAVDEILVEFSRELTRRIVKDGI